MNNELVRGEVLPADAAVKKEEGFRQKRAGEFCVQI